MPSLCGLCVRANLQVLEADNLPQRRRQASIEAVPMYISADNGWIPGQVLPGLTSNSDTPVY